MGLMDLSDSLLHLSTPLISTGPGRYTGVEDCPRVALPRAIVGSDTPIFYLRVGDSVFLPIVNPPRILMVRIGI